MPISSISITQDNKSNGSNLEPIQSPLIFLAQVIYTVDPPDIVYVEVYDKDQLLLETYKAIPYQDTTLGERLFAFVANDAIKSLMNGFEDFNQLLDTTQYVEEITKQFYIRFVDPDNSLIFDEVLIDFAQAARQFGEEPNLKDQYDNDWDFYFSGLDQFVYVYFYNDDVNNVVTINEGGIVDGLAQDFDDSVFTDFDDEDFVIEYLN